MTLQGIPALFMRGGTSNGLVFARHDLPKATSDWDKIFLSAMGSPDSNGRQLDGMGGGYSSVSKVCVVGPTERDDADVDYTFAQIAVDQATVDYAGNCGNMVSTIGPAALEFGFMDAADQGDTTVRIHNTNTGKIIVARFQTQDGLLSPGGSLAIDGVAGTAAPIRLDFQEPGGSKTGQLLPSGSPSDQLELPRGEHMEASLVDAANPCVFVAAQSLGKTGAETPSQLAGDPDFMRRMEEVRRAGSVKMKLTKTLEAAGNMPSIPKVAMVSSPTSFETLSGQVADASEATLMTRMISMEQPHRAVPITGAICLAVACRVPGSIPARAAQNLNAALTIAHPSGSVLVDAKVVQDNGLLKADYATIYRTARKLFSGTVHFR